MLADFPTLIVADAESAFIRVSICVNLRLVICVNLRRNLR